jgi:hypothetical protein
MEKMSVKPTNSEKAEYELWAASITSQTPIKNGHPKVTVLSN